MKLTQLLPCLAASLVLAACGGSDNKSDNNTNNQPNNQSGNNSGGETKGPLYLVKTTSWTTDDGIALHYITDTLNAETKFDESKALAIPGYTGVAIPEGANPDRAFYVGLNPKPVFQRYVVSNSGAISLDKELDFTNLGLTNGRALMRSAKFMSETKGYILDAKTLQIIEFNPSAMTITAKISLAALEESTLPNRWSIFPVADGDRFIATISYYDANWKSAAHTKAVILDSKTNTFVTDTSTECGSVSSSAKDASGNIYFASHDETAVSYYKGTGAFPPCIIRINSGANEWDDSYVMNMQNLTNDSRLAMTAMTGKGNTGYTLVLSPEAQAKLTNEVHFKSLIKNIWEFHSVDLTDDSATATKINYPHKTISRVQFGSFNHDELGDISWMFHISDDWGTSTIINSTDPAKWSDITSVPGQLETVGRLQ